MVFGKKIPVLDMLTGKIIGSANVKKIKSKIVGYDVFINNKKKFVFYDEVEKIKDSIVLMPEWLKMANFVVKKIEEYEKKYPEITDRGSLEEIEELEKFSKLVNYVLVILKEKEISLRNSQMEILQEISRLYALRTINRVGILEFSERMEELERKYGIIEYNLNNCIELMNRLKNSIYAKRADLHLLINLRSNLKSLIESEVYRNE